LREELGNDVLVTGDFEAAPSYSSQLYMKVEDPDKGVIWSDQDAKQGTFALTTSVAGEYAFCFLDMPRQGQAFAPGTKRRVTFEYRTGVAARDYSEVAKREHLEPLAVELRKMEDLVRDVNSDMQYLRDRERLMRDTNESTNSRVIWLGIVSSSVLVVLGFAQIYSFYAYLKHKKVL
jgi:p24 family protein delta-1